MPSRQACLDGVAATDAYLLLIGPYYGHRFDDTGQSPTHDEWVAAQSAGIPRLVFLKEGIEMDDDQKEFYGSVFNYTSGVFYDSFTSTAELLTKVARGPGSREIARAVDMVAAYRGRDTGVATGLRPANELELLVDSGPTGGACPRSAGPTSFSETDW